MVNEWGPKDKPEGACQYLARDGKYYNGYMSSPDCAEDFIAPGLKVLSEKLEEEFGPELIDLINVLLKVGD